MASRPLDPVLLPPAGQELTERRVVAHVTGPVFQLLRGERLALNTITRASGIATAARRVATLAADAGWHGEVAGTRKTTPGAWSRRRGRGAPFSVAHAGFPWAVRAGFRLAEKYALLVGGASAHRMDLSGMVMLKGAWWAGLEAGGRTGGAHAPPTGLPPADNHVWATGGIAASVKRARQAAGFSSKIEVECRSLEEACEAVRLDVASCGGWPAPNQARSRGKPCTARARRRRPAPMSACWTTLRPRTCTRRPAA